MIVMSPFYHHIVRGADNFSVFVYHHTEKSFRWEDFIFPKECWTLSHMLELEWTTICVLKVRKKKRCA